MEKGLTSYVLNYLLSTCFDSKADMARQLDMSKRALQRVMNEPQLSKGGSVALVKALCYCARHHVPVDPILREYAAHDTDHQKDFIYDPSTINLAAYTRLTLPMPEHLTAEGAEVFASMLRFLQRASAHICPNCMVWCNPWDGTARFMEGSCYLARMARCICREVASLYTESWNKL
jgi:hypothetical protein